MRPYPAYKASGVDWLGEVPEGWEVRRFKEILREREERSVDGNETLLSVSAYTGVTPRSENLDEGEFLTRAESLEGYKICFRGDLVMNIMLAWNRAQGITSHDGIVSPAYAVFAPSEEVHSQFLNYLVRSNEYCAYFKAFSSGVIESRLRLYPQTFGSLHCIFPPLPEQRAIAAFLDREVGKIDALVEESRQLIALLAEKRQATISHAVTRGLNPAARLRPSGIDWLGDIPEGWEVVRIKYLAGLAGRIGFRGYTTQDIVAAEDGALAISPGNLKDGVVSTDSGTYVSWDKFYESPEIIVKPSDVIVVKTGSTYGKVARFNIDAIPPATINPQMLLLKEASCGRDYLYFSVAATGVQAAIRASNTGGTIPTITQEFVGNLQIVIPPTDQKDEIVAYLNEEMGRFDALTAEANSAISLLLERRAALISAAVTGKIDVRGAAPAQAQERT